MIRLPGKGLTHVGPAVHSESSLDGTIVRYESFPSGRGQDSRILGVEPPQALRLRMKLKDDEVCELLKGAPLLWYCELKNALLSLGFAISPKDPCLFVLPKKNIQSEKEPKIHRVLGVHIDDGLGGGDQTFNQTIKHWKSDSHLVVNRKDHPSPLRASIWYRSAMEIYP